MPGVRTIGVAVAVPEPHSTSLQQHRAAFGDPQAEAIPPHVTLLAPTEVADPDLDLIGKHLRAVASQHSPFFVHLRGTGTFRPVSPVVFVTLVEGISDCEKLEADVRTGPLAVDTSFNYHPHVTVAHHLPDDKLDAAFAALADFEARFEVNGFWLYEHGSDGVWRPQRRFGFGPPR